jgi:hypothetical protein
MDRASPLRLSINNNLFNDSYLRAGPLLVVIAERFRPCSQFPSILFESNSRLIRTALEGFSK